MTFRVHALYRQGLPEAAALRTDAALRTVVARRLPEQLTGASVPEFSGAIEAWFDDVTDAQTWAARLRAESLAAALLVTRDYALFSVPWSGASIKGKFLFRRKADMDAADFSTYWRERHGPIVGRTPELLRYVQSHVVAPDDHQGAYDAITELHWRDYAAALRSMGSREMTVEQARDAANFAAPGSVEILLVAETVVG